MEVTFNIAEGFEFICLRKHRRLGWQATVAVEDERHYRHLGEGTSAEPQEAIESACADALETQELMRRPSLEEAPEFAELTLESLGL